MLCINTRGLWADTHRGAQQSAQGERDRAANPMTDHCHTRAPAARDCEACPHHHVDVLGATPEPDRERLRAFFRLRGYGRGETIYGEGDRGAHVALIREGLVKLVLYSPSGTERIVRLAMPGDTIGLELMLGGRFHHTAVALTDVELCQMPLELVDDRFAHAPGFAKRVLAEWHASVDDAERFLTELSTGSAHARVARLLVYLHERGRSASCPAIGREDMGALLGITTETASRVVAELKREGRLRETAQGRFEYDAETMRTLTGGASPAS